jgi:hypothetical protein
MAGGFVPNESLDRIGQQYEFYIKEAFMKYIKATS